MTQVNLKELERETYKKDALRVTVSFQKKVFYGTSAIRETAKLKLSWNCYIEINEMNLKQQH